MDRPSEADTSPSARQWHSEPDTPATEPLPEEAETDEARIQSLRAPTDVAVHRLPMEIWIAVCEALRQLDLSDIENGHSSMKEVYPELRRATENKSRPDPIITAVSILQLSQTCRYLHKVASPCLLETIRLRPPSGGDANSAYLSVIQQVKSLQLNDDQRLQHVRGFAVALPHDHKDEYTGCRSDIRDQMCHLLTRFTNLRHLTVIGVALDVPLMQKILTLPLEHLWLWDVEPENPIADHRFIVTTTPKPKLLSLVVQEDSWPGNPSIPIDWISQLIGTAMQDLSFDASELVTSALPVLPHLEFLEVPPDHRIFLIAPSTLYELLSKTPNLKQAAIGVEASRGDPGDAIPALAHMERVVCHVTWLGFLIPRRPVTTAKVLYESRVQGQGLFEILHKSSMPLRDLTLTYVPQWRQPSWSPDDLKLVARYLPELEILRLKIRGHKVDGLQEALFYISQLQKLRIISFSTSDKPGMVDSSGTQDDIWQESKLREFLGLTRSPVLERVGFGEEREWKLEDTGVWMLWQGGRMVRSVSL